MKVALLGFAQSGKKTLFSLLTGRKVPPGRKEGEGVEGTALVRDPRVDEIARIVKPERIRYAEVTFVLCPDVEEAAQKRLWLDAARRCDVLGMVVRAFTDQSVYHPLESVDADRDRKRLETEVRLADLELIETRLNRISREKKGGVTAQQQQEEKTLQRCAEVIEAEKSPLTAGIDPHDLVAIRSLGLLTLKEIMWTYNVDESDVKDTGYDPLTIACKIEEEIMQIENLDERKQYLADLGLTHAGVDRMNQAAYDKLGLMSFYTMGEDEARAWTIRKGTLAPAAAGKIHSDIERGFIRVEVIKYDDLMALGSEKAVHDHGKAAVRGKDYVIEDGDICMFRFNV